VTKALSESRARNPDLVGEVRDSPRVRRVLMEERERFADHGIARSGEPSLLLSGGPKNLLALSQYAAQPCRFDNQGFRTQSVTPPVGTLTPVFCTPVIKDNPSTMTVFDAWANMSGSDPVSVARASVARGQVIFNTKDLTVPPDLIPQFGGQSIHCITCHAVNNVKPGLIP